MAETKVKKDTKVTKKSEKKSDNFAVIETGGKQYKVVVGNSIKIEKLIGVEEGEKVSFDKVVLSDDGKKTVIGTPYIDKAKVEAEVIKTGRAKKITVVKYKAKSRYHKKRGHRQPFVEVKITKV